MKLCGPFLDGNSAVFWSRVDWKYVVLGDRIDFKEVSVCEWVGVYTPNPHVGFGGPQRGDRWGKDEGAAGGEGDRWGEEEGAAGGGGWRGWGWEGTEEEWHAHAGRRGLTSN